MTAAARRRFLRAPISAISPEAISSRSFRSTAPLAVDNLRLTRLQAIGPPGEQSDLFDL